MKKILYEIVFAILAIISVILAIIDMKSRLHSWQKNLDIIIWIVFVADYSIRLIKSKDIKGFFKGNLFDFIAILPFNSFIRLFRGFKLLKVIKLAKLFKLLRFTAILSRAYKNFSTFFNTNGFKYILFFSIFITISGGALVSYVENKSFSDGIWWAFVTITTVGYGDISPTTNFGRIVASILMLVGIGLVGSLTSTITTFFMNKTKSKDIVSNERVDMVLKLYMELNPEEKEIFNKLK